MSQAEKVELAIAQLKAHGAGKVTEGRVRTNVSLVPDKRELLAGRNDIDWAKGRREHRGLRWP